MTEDPRQDIVENFNKYKIGLDEVFTFKCRGCGKCCKNREDILLNSRDVYNIATALNLTHKQVTEQYCETYIGKDSRMPIVRLKPKGVNLVCPLLKGGRCSIHSLKPTVCALFPLGRVMAFEDKGPGKPFEIQYILTSADCGSAKKKQTVRAWLEAFDIPVEDHFFTEWNKALFSLISTVKKLSEKLSSQSKVYEMIWVGIYMALYVDYDTQKEFDSQFKNNVNKILDTFSKFEN